MEKDFKVYGLFAPGRIPELFYIGKGKGRRMLTHFCPSRKGENLHKDAVIAKYPSCYPKILFDNLTEEEAFAIEVSAIAQTKRLTNLTNGGEGIRGYAHTAETKAKISEAMVGKYAGEKSPSFGKTLSEETRAKMSEANAGEKSVLAKLTWDQVHEIRERLAAGEKGFALAKEFWVCKTTISDIKNNKKWKETK